MTNEAAIREALAEHGRMGTDAHTITTDADLYAAGMTSHASVNVMIAIEDALDVEFPDALLTRDSFASIDRAVETIQHS